MGSEKSNEEIIINVFSYLSAINCLRPIDVIRMYSWGVASASHREQQIVPS